MKNLDLAVQFFLQLGRILLFCRFVGAIAVKFGQPQVVAEMIAPILAGFQKCLVTDDVLNEAGLVIGLTLVA